MNRIIENSQTWESAIPTGEDVQQCWGTKLRVNRVESTDFIQQRPGFNIAGNQISR